MLKKASKRLMTAIISLVVSVILCVGVCLAWFAVNNKVGGEGMTSQLRGDDIISFKVTAYYLNKTSADTAATVTYAIATDGNKNANNEAIKDGGSPISVDNSGVKGVIDNGDIMRPFSLGGTFTTTVLFKLEYEIASDTEKNFRIFAECPCPLTEENANDPITRLKVVKIKENEQGYVQGNEYKSNLSNAVTLAKAGINEDKSYSATEAYKPFVNNNHEKSFRRPFYDGINKNTPTLTVNEKGNLQAESYVMMDYDKDRFAYLSALMLKSGGSLSSKLNLLGDITFVMEEYDTEETVTVESIARDALAPNAVYTQTAGADAISDTWQFVVTYTDGSKKIVKKSAQRTDGTTLTVGGLTTQTAGEYTGENGAKVTYTELNTEVECTVPYSVNIAISGGTNVAIKDTLQLSLVGLPSGVTVNWTSDNKAVATVDNNGLVTGVAEGSATIKAASSDGKYTAEYTVHVVGEKVQTTNITLNKTSLTLTEGDTETLIPKVEPDNATDSVIWTTSDSAVATVNNGVVTAVKAGSATITATAGSKTATCTVTVKAATVAVTGVTLDQTTLTLKMGETTTANLTATVAPENATDKTVTWTSDKESVATVDSNGKVTAKAAGTATITVTTTDGSKTAKCKVTVENKNYTVTFNANGHGTAPDTQTVEEGGKATKPTDLTANGYTFGGWFTQNGANGNWGDEFNFNTAITANITLHAKWTEESGGTVTEVVYSFTAGNKNPSCDNTNGTIVLSDSGTTKQNGYVKISRNSGGSITLTIKNVSKDSKVTIQILDRDGKSDKTYALTVTNLTGSGNEYTVTDAGDIVFIIKDNTETDYYFGSATVTIKP